VVAIFHNLYKNVISRSSRALRNLEMDRASRLLTMNTLSGILVEISFLDQISRLDFGQKRLYPHADVSPNHGKHRDRIGSALYLIDFPYTAPALEGSHISFSEYIGC
jgi:hypothetical protein